MKRENKNIRKLLLAKHPRTDETEKLADEYGYHANYIHFILHIGKWNPVDEFPVEDIKKYVRLHQWSYKEFCITAEMLIKKHLPACMLDVFHDLKVFKSHSRSELTEDQRGYARLYNIPVETQEQKASLIYDVSLMQYINRSKFKGNNDDE